MKFLSADRLHIGMLVETMFWGKSIGACLIVSHEFNDSVDVLSGEGLFTIDFELMACSMIEI